METQTRYNLTAAIENWRTELAAQAGLTPEVRRELETHLRDTIAGFQQRGLNDEESFWLARRRVGQPQQLGEEFVKANPAAVWRERVFWMWLAVFLFSTLGGIANSLNYVLMHVWGHPDSWDKVREITQYALLILIVVLIANGKLITQFSRLMLLIENRRRLTMTALVCVVLSFTVRFAAMVKFFWPMDTHSTSGWIWRWIWQNYSEMLYFVVMGLVLILLLPPQNRKTPKRA